MSWSWHHRKVNIARLLGDILTGSRTKGERAIGADALRARPVGIGADGLEDPDRRGQHNQHRERQREPSDHPRGNPDPFMAQGVRHQ